MNIAWVVQDVLNANLPTTSSERFAVFASSPISNSTRPSPWDACDELLGIGPALLHTCQACPVTSDRCGRCGSGVAIAANRYGMEEWQRAADAFAAIIKQYPGHARASLSRFFLAESLVQLGKFGEAQIHFRAFVENESESDYLGQAIYRIGEAALLTGDHAQAQEWLERFHSEFPRHALASYSWPYLADAYFETKQYDKAREAYSTALAKHPNAALTDHCQMGLARCHELSGNSEEASRFLNMLAEGESKLAEPALYDAIRLHREKGDQGGVVSRCQQYLTQFADGPHVFDIRVLLAEIELLTSNLEPAWQQLQPILECETSPLDPQVDAIAAEAFFRTAELCLGQADVARANRLLTRIEELWPNSDWADDAAERLIRLASDRDEHASVYRLASDFAEHYPNSDLMPFVCELWGRSLYDEEQFRPPSIDSKQHCSPPKIRRLIKSSKQTCSTFWG